MQGKSRLAVVAALLIGSIVLHGCAQPKIVVTDEVSTGSQGNHATILLEDVRPEADKNYTIGSVLVFKEDYGIWTLGDEMFSPNALELLKKYVNSETSKWNPQPSAINIKLKRLKFEANHQADLLDSSSNQLGPLGVAIAESMHGKTFERDYDKTRPFVLGFIDADVKISFPDGKVVNKSLSAYKAENFSSHVDVKGRQTAAAKTIKDLLGSFSKSL